MSASTRSKARLARQHRPEHSRRPSKPADLDVKAIARALLRADDETVHSDWRAFRRTTHAMFTLPKERHAEFLDEIQEHCFEGKYALGMFVGWCAGAVDPELIANYPDAAPELPELVVMRRDARLLRIALRRVRKPWNLQDLARWAQEAGMVDDVLPDLMDAALRTSAVEPMGREATDILRAIASASPDRLSSMTGRHDEDDT